MEPRRRRLIAALLALGLLAALLFVAAAVHEVTSLGGRLGRTLSRLEPPARPRPPGPPIAGPGGSPAAARPAADASWTEVQFSVTAADVSRLLRRSDARLGGALVRERDVEARLEDGRVVLATRNRFGVLGVTVADYAGDSAWRLAALPGAVGIALGELRVAGIPAPFAGRLLGWLSGRDRDGWVVFPTGGRRVLERVEVGAGTLTVAGRVR